MNYKELSDEELRVLSTWERYSIEPMATMQCCGNYLPTGECCTAQFGCGALVHGCEEQQVENDPATAPDWETLAKELASRLSRTPVGTVGERTSELTPNVLKDLKDAKRKVRESRQLMVLLRAEIAAKRAVLSAICQLSKGGTDHMGPTDAVRIRTIHELASRNSEHPELSPIYARSLPSEAQRGVSFPHLTSREPLPTGGEKS